MYGEQLAAGAFKELASPIAASSATHTDKGFSSGKMAAQKTVTGIDPAQNPALIRPGRDAAGNKLPIYADADRPVTLIETPHPISPYIAQAREATQSVFSGAGTYVEGGVSRWIGFERKVEREVKSVLPRDEPLTPGIIYVLIAGLSGSVLTRTRSFPIRWLTPPIFTLIAAPYFLPQTSANIRAYLSRAEDQHLPALAKEHDRLNNQLGGLFRSSVQAVEGAGAQARGWSKAAVQTVEDNTGLRVGEGIRKAQEAASGEVRKRVEEARAARNQKVETVGYVVEQRPVAEIVRPVEGAAATATQKPASRLV